MHKKPKPQINPTDSVEELVESYPQIVSFLLRKNIVCVKCGEPYWGTIGELIAGKGGDVNALLAELNSELDRNRK